ncbi:rhodanese-like domain-containing protein [Rhabdochromatium marinum]|uniref:rhodanese-like domain-containing protein n=1 Tax=Rhabdochromatium marinum TaxID=48729 RepID=UPI001903E6D4|nr:rhodanese-like domain-containing protein [Rhabdochromatium marinum]MBK1649675.1 hypothetical protein [Rhabdochromatium marinum]
MLRLLSIPLLLSSLCVVSLTQAADDFIVQASPESVAGATTVDDATAKTLFDDGVIFIDVRSQQAFDKGRIPDAELLDFKTQFTAAALADIAALDEPLVIYCQGPKCARAAEAVQQALDWGYTDVNYYRSGFPGWKAAGYPVE